MPEPLTLAILSAAGAYVGKPVVEEFLKKITGPLADEMGQAVAAPLKEWRAERAAKMIGRSIEMIAAAELDVEPVQPKILLPLIECASLEDSDDLTELWSALLSNAAAVNQNNVVHPRFIQILRQLTPLEAAMLRDLKTHEQMGAEFWDEGQMFQFMISAPPSEVPAALDALVSLGLADREAGWREVGEGNVEMVTPGSARVKTSRFGEAFLRAVTPPTAADAPSG